LPGITWAGIFVRKKNLEETNVTTIKLESILASLSVLRLMRPAQVKEMEESLQRLGQLQPIIVRPENEQYQLIDGFKRYYSSEALGWSQLQAKIIEVTEAQGKAMILNYNKASNSLVEYEEALVVYSLVKEHMMDQKEISLLLGYSRSWVSRRVGLIEKLSTTVQDQLRMGVISNSHTRSIIKLPRGNQQEITSIIIKHNLTCRQSNVLIEKYLQTGNNQERAYIINNPVEAIKMAEKNKEIYDCRLSAHGNKLLKTSELLITQQHIFKGQYSSHQTGQLKESEKTILCPKIGQVLKTSQHIIQMINKKQEEDERH
jgi:ParB/RepB/Spo0J family partition protein